MDDGFISDTDLAKKMREIERAYMTGKNEDGTYNHWISDNTHEWKLNETTSVRLSDDFLMFYVWRDDGNSLYFKAVPFMGYSQEEINAILSAQKWIGY